jgi:lycopene elongase/hydratase (dihydrobisanhydrobacterioruberin-forming)
MANPSSLREARARRVASGAALANATAGRSAYVWAMIRVTRPWFWPLGWAGAYLGAVMGSHSWMPPAHTLPESLTTAVVLGPLVWGAVLTINDLHDLASDRHNPRKTTGPLVTGVLTGADLARWHWVFAVSALVVAAAVGPAFVAGTGGVLLLGWLYSVPPVRLKARPGADVVANAVPVGVLAPLAGWSLHRPITDYPPVMVLLGVALVAALYLPTTVMDSDADKVAGDTTAAVAWQPRTCYRLGLVLWAGAIAVWLLCCHLDILAAGETWSLQVAMAPVLLVVYAVLTRTPSIARMAAISAVFAVPAADFLAACVAAGGSP